MVALPSFRQVFVETCAIFVLFILQYFGLLMLMGNCLTQPTSKDVTLCTIGRWKGIYDAYQCLGIIPRSPSFSETQCHAFLAPSPPPMHPTMAAILDGYWH